METLTIQHLNKLGKFWGVIGFIFLFTIQCNAQSYPFKVKKSIYHKGWIDLNKNGKMDPYENPNLPVKKRIDDLLSRMTINEKTAQLVTLYGYGAVLKDQQPTPAWLDTTWKDGVANIDEQLNGGHGHPDHNLLWPPSRHAKALNNVQRFFIEQTRLGVPVDFTNEGIRGLKAYKATSFPVEIGQGSTWDPDLVNKIGKVEGEEARALGYTNVYSPEADVARDPRWGRVPSTYGEDPYLNSKLSVAMVKGLQSEHTVSTLKHFAVYSVPKGGRDGADRTDPHVTERELMTLFNPPFKASFEAGALGVMSSYNDYDGIPVTGSYHFLTQLLRQKWGFKGYVVTDSGALQFLYSKHHVQKDFQGAAKQALEAGVNVRTDFQKPIVYLKPLREDVRDGDIPMSVLNQRVREVLRVKYWLGLFDQPYVNTSESNSKVRKPSSIALSLKAAEESLVLLKNDNNVLPLNKNNIHSVLVTGPDATMKNSLINGYGPRGVKVTTVLQGIKNEVDKGTKVTYVKGPNVRDKNFPESDIMETSLSQNEKDQIQKAVEAAKHSNVAIVVVGENNRTVGEGRSRVSLKLPGHQLALVKAVYNTGTPTVVVLLNGQPLTINWTNAHVPAILEGWFPGAKTGDAIAKALFGEYNPGGKLPITFPKTVGQVPLNFPYLPASESYMPNDPKARARVTGPLYPFGYGLSYTHFKFSDLQVTPYQQKTGGKIKVSFNVENTGSRKGDEVAQLYIHEKLTPVIIPVSELRGFKRVTIDPGQSKRVEFELTPHDLQILNKHMEWEVYPGDFEVMVGNSSTDIRLKGNFKITGKVANKAYGF
ncbi:MAG TPA: glycoside hydrolase family 3 N-terminal domain-containing protein [Balneolales bacterium]|nr:glycoside hydrolase family 3 N-terminal domain-containing protein [Balneolales bacterium]